jgi:glycosyltransferase involved in cell wall biosynthesis
VPAISEGEKPLPEFPTVLMIMVCMHCTLGGAEKQYARVFEMLVAQAQKRHRLLITRALLSLLQSAGLLTGMDDHLIVLDPPYRRKLQTPGSRFLNNPISTRLAGMMDAIWYVWQIWNVLGHLQPDVAHPLLTGVYLSLPGLIARPRIGRLMSAYSYSFESYRDRRIFGLAVGATIKRLAMQRSQAIDALTLAIRDDLIARGIPAGLIRAAPSILVDAKHCTPAGEKNDWVVFLGRLVQIKNPLLFVEAIPLVLSRRPGVRFFILGSGDQQPDIEQRLDELGVQEQVTLRFEPHPDNILAKSKIFVSLQQDENYPSQSLLEAMACANAIVATDVGETWLLVDESNGRRVPPQAEAVAGAILQLLADPRLPERCAASRRRVLEEHPPEKYYDYICSLYQAAASRSG